MFDDGKANAGDKRTDGNGVKPRGGSGARGKTAEESGSVTTEQTHPDVPVTQSAPAECG